MVWKHVLKQSWTKRWPRTRSPKAIITCSGNGSRGRGLLRVLATSHRSWTNVFPLRMNTKLPVFSTSNIFRESLTCAENGNSMWHKKKLKGVIRNVKWLTPDIQKDVFIPVSYVRILLTLISNIDFLTSLRSRNFAEHLLIKRRDSRLDIQTESVESWGTWRAEKASQTILCVRGQSCGGPQRRYLSCSWEFYWNVLTCMLCIGACCNTIARCSKSIHGMFRMFVRIERRCSSSAIARTNTLLF